MVAAGLSYYVYYMHPFIVYVGDDRVVHIGRESDLLRLLRVADMVYCSRDDLPSLPGAVAAEEDDASMMWLTHYVSSSLSSIYREMCDLLGDEMGGFIFQSKRSHDGIHVVVYIDLKSDAVCEVRRHIYADNEVFIRSASLHTWAELGEHIGKLTDHHRLVSFTKPVHA